MDNPAPAALPCGDSTRMGRILSDLEPRFTAVFGGADNAEQGAAAREERARLERALARLTAEERSLITESALQGRPYSALGQELGLSTRAVSSRAFRARRRLAAELEAI